MEDHAEASAKVRTERLGYQNVKKRREGTTLTNTTPRIDRFRQMTVQDDPTRDLFVQGSHRSTKYRTEIHLTLDSVEKVLIDTIERFLLKSPSTTWLGQDRRGYREETKNSCLSLLGMGQ